MPPPSGLPPRPGLVSIVLPVFNGERYLAEAIDSVRRQIHPDWELIVVDDGSTDQSRAIALHLASLDGRIRVVAQPNLKLPAALSTGFRQARGEYFTWTSADNRLLPEFLSRLVGELERHPEWDMVTADLRMIDEAGRPLRESPCIKRFQDSSDTSIVHYPDDFSLMEREVCNVVGGAFLYRARCGRILGDYDDTTFTAEDYEYWLRLGTYFTIRHAGFHEPVYDYRFHTQSLTARAAELETVALSERLLRRHQQRKARPAAGLGLVWRAGPAEGPLSWSALQAAAAPLGEVPLAKTPDAAPGDTLILEVPPAESGGLAPGASPASRAETQPAHRFEVSVSGEALTLTGPGPLTVLVPDLPVAVRLALNWSRVENDRRAAASAPAGQTTQSAQPQTRDPRENIQQEPGPPERNHLVDLGRLALAVSVMVYHAKVRKMHDFPVLFAGFAVPAFLAISGWYVLGSYLHSPSWQQFWIKRAARIFPALGISLLLVLGLGGLPSLVDTLKVYLFAGVASTPHSMNGALWSLGAEEVAYFVLAALAAVGFYRSAWPSALAALGALFAVSALHATRITSAMAQTTAIIPAFFAGSACYLARHRLKKFWWLGLAGLAYGLYLSIPGLKMPNYGLPLNFHPMTSGVLVGTGILLLGHGLKVRLPGLPDLSYSIYIYHMPVFMAAKKYQVSFGPAVLVVLCTSLASWYLVEQPVLRLARRWRPSSGRA